LSESPYRSYESQADADLTISLIIGSIGRRLAAVQLSDSRGVSIPGKVTSIPGAPLSLSGLVYFRGGIEAVVNLAAVWGETSVNFPTTARSVLLEAEGMRAVVIFDELLDLYDCPKNDLRSSDIELAGISSVFDWRGKEVFLLSGSELLRYVEAFVSLNSHKR